MEAADRYYDEDQADRKRSDMSACCFKKVHVVNYYNCCKEIEKL